MAYVRRHAACPYPLRYAFQGHAGALPAAGGLRDQPARLMLTMTAAHNLYLAVTGYDQVKAGARAKWKAEHPDLANALAMARANGWM